MHCVTGLPSTHSSVTPSHRYTNNLLFPSCCSLHISNKNITIFIMAKYSAPMKCGPIYITWTSLTKQWGQAVWDDFYVVRLQLDWSLFQVYGQKEEEHYYSKFKRFQSYNLHASISYASLQWRRNKKQIWTLANTDANCAMIWTL